MTGVWIGVGAFLALSVVVNLFDHDFREGALRMVLGLLTAPVFLVVLAHERFRAPTTRRISPQSMARFVDANRNVYGWAFSYRGRGVLILRSPKR